MEKILYSEKKVQRHGIAVRFVHWTAALSTLVLLFSGFGQMPMYKRYMLDQLPGLGWSSNFSITLTMHYIAAAILVFAAVFHAVYHLARKDFAIMPRRSDVKESVQIIKAMLGFGEEPANDKYLAEQRLAYGYIAFSLVLIILTGLVKVIKNLPGITLGDTFLNWATNLHNLGTGLLLLGLVGHMLAFTFKENRFLLPAMFSGKIDLEYARHRHGKWFERLSQRQEKTKSHTGHGAAQHGTSMEKTV